MLISGTVKSEGGWVWSISSESSKGWAKCWASLLEVTAVGRDRSGKKEKVRLLEVILTKCQKSMTNYSWQRFDIFFWRKKKFLVSGKIDLGRFPVDNREQGCQKLESLHVILQAWDKRNWPSFLSTRDREGAWKVCLHSRASQPRYYAGRIQRGLWLRSGNSFMRN